ncbi:MAG: acetate kinase [Actinobacteria bacterium]|nr:acetate kinase [Actinomycetota bacterium]MCB9413526.1 acetate kinase [Actinomycetota bacterium]
MSRLVQVINSGSSSIKYQLLDISDPDRPVVWAAGLVEAIGEPGSRLVHRSRIGRGADSDFVESELTGSIPDHTAGFAAIGEAFAAAGPIEEVGELAAFGHRVVHGGDTFSAPALIDDAVIGAIEDCIPLAPLHNPANLAGIVGARAAYPDVAQVAVFDTAFHQTMPPAAYTYAIDRQIAADHRIRRYGFHGTSHAYVARQAVRQLHLDPTTAKVITLHLGNGASACAVSGGRSIDTSMGMTPLAGLVMGTRSGDIDPAIALHLQRVAGLTADDVDALLNMNSGMKGLAGANDLREIHTRSQAGDAAATLALEVYAHRIREYLGAYLVALGGADVIVFTAGVGENDHVIREMVCKDLAWLGVALDSDANARRSGDSRVVSRRGSPIAVMVVPTNEELEIALQTLEVLGG